MVERRDGATLSRALAAAACMSDIESRPPETASTTRRACSPCATSSRSESSIPESNSTGSRPRSYHRFRGNAHSTRNSVETHGPLGVIWVSLGLVAFYIALIWINSLLGLDDHAAVHAAAQHLWTYLGKKPVPPAT